MEKDIVIKLTNRKAIVKNSEDKFYFHDSALGFFRTEFDMISERSRDHLLDVKLNGLWGLMDRNGRLLVYPQYDDPIYLNQENIAYVKYEDNYGVLDENYKVLIPALYHGIEPLYYYMDGDEDIICYVCYSDGPDYVSYAQLNNYISHIYEGEYGVDIYLPNGTMLPDKYRCFYIPGYLKIFLASEKGRPTYYRNIEDEVGIKSFLGIFDVLDIYGNILLTGVDKFYVIKYKFMAMRMFKYESWIVINPSLEYIDVNKNTANISQEVPANFIWTLNDENDVIKFFEVLKEYDTSFDFNKKDVNDFLVCVLDLEEDEENESDYMDSYDQCENIDPFMIKSSHYNDILDMDQQSEEFYDTI